MLTYIIIFSILSYLIGSFSSAVWFGRWFWNTDVREFGSKNAGATNTFRVLGAKAGLIVFVFDVLKSFAAIQLVRLVPELQQNSELYIQIKILFGACAIIGHIFPVFSQFRGGKGVASMLGFIIAIHPLAAGITFGVFLIVFLISRIVSLSSISAALAFPFIIYFLEKGNSLTLTIFSIIATCLIILTHLKNIKRLLKGEEKPISFSKKS
ncbi:MAG: glycerol-3-phosphate 1-O-acyltransferase PlsY [Bacteroidota bacterium]|jgi:glycerol-3-phosphate acyltransferase PlsY|nr:glycerol-3-phosphate 1-O-acyltransferase PlsY [Bacteroidales bacterium]MDI9536244.1 glycerol-3-phosphate 1-O-acyltransferase PlsY [Bacteroidota bacterium]NLP20877.1 glycerol-3-phosphate 1-O-acyltransferase PlsY [Bacteroidales bacterium]HOR60545.1 glycerol-3-phosphate 1-O-acyltransferase PlsY [Bacteroidales bacterium]HPX76859.1 glycerol-3-phosphate 1-O-acyltransferase PlsY [Bacteroidales bacterium]